MNSKAESTKAMKVVSLAMAGTLVFGVALAPVAVTAQQAEASTASQLKSQAKKALKAARATKGSKKAKVKKAAAYAVKSWSYTSLGEVRTHNSNAASNKKGWWKKAALYQLKAGKGSCYTDAAAVALMAKRASGYKVRVASGKARSKYWNPGGGVSATKTQNHAWAEVKVGKTWYVYDVTLDRYATDSKGSGKYIAKKRSALKKVYCDYKGVKYQTVKL